MTRFLITARMLTLTFFLLLAIVPPALAQTNEDALTEFVENGMALWHVPGMAVTVVSSDQVLYQQGFGVIADGQDEKVDNHTLFAIASTTKAMVVAGILMLADEEKVSLDDPIVKYLPELHFSDPLLTGQVMVRDLLAHRTGLPSTDFWTFFQEMPLDEQIRRLGDIPAAAPLRTRLIYQNTMFELAGLLIDRVSGMPWDQFLRQRLWQPIGMNETFAARGQAGDSMSYVRPYFFSDGALVPAEWDFPADMADAAGSVWSSIHDMGLWAQFLLHDGVTADGERLISEERMADMFRPQQLSSAADFYPTVELTRPNWMSYGLGWFQQDFQGRKIDFHTGSLSGLVAIIGLDRAAGRAVVVLGNRDHAELRHAILWSVMDNRAPADQPDWNREVFDLYEGLAAEQEEKWADKVQKRLPDTHSTLPLDEYTGTYESPGMGPVRIVRADDGLAIRMPKADFPMSHWHLDTFLVEYEPWEMREFGEFRIGPDGSVTALELFGQTFLPAPEAE